MQKNISKIVSISSPIAIFFLAFLIRIYNLGLLPINYDEAHFARFLLCRFEYLKKIIGIPLYSIPYIPQQCIRFLAARLPNSHPGTIDEFLLHVRFQPVAVGAITVLLLYVLANRMYGKKTAAISSLFLCFLPWHIILSRNMCRVIWIPLFGCLIVLCLLNAAHAKRKLWAGAWYLLACFFLREALYEYESAILFIPIFVASLIILSKEACFARKLRTFSIALLLAVLFSSPIIYKIAAMRNGFWEHFYREYQTNIFAGPLFLNILENFKNNIGIALQQLFFTARASSLLYGQPLKAPLLIHPMISILLVVSFGFALWRRRSTDKILAIWLLLGFLGAIAGINFFQARYVLIILPPALILIANGIAEIFNRMFLTKRIIIRCILLIVGVTIVGGIITAEIIQWVNFYYEAPFDLEQNRVNSYGAKEAGEYLSKLPDIYYYRLCYDYRMTVDVYLHYYLLNNGTITMPDMFQYYYLWSTGLKTAQGTIYVVWAPESHPREICEDWYLGLYQATMDFFEEKCSNAKPIKIVYYPNGLAAIKIFKIEDSETH